MPAVAVDHRGYVWGNCFKHGLLADDADLRQSGRKWFCGCLHPSRTARRSCGNNWSQPVRAGSFIRWYPRVLRVARTVHPLKSALLIRSRIRWASRSPRMNGGVAGCSNARNTTAHGPPPRPALLTPSNLRSSTVQKRRSILTRFRKSPAA